MKNNNDVAIRVYLVQFPLILRVYGLGLPQTNWTAQQWHEVFIHVPNGQITTKQRRMSLSDESRCFALKHNSCGLKKRQNKRFWFRKAQQQKKPINCELRSHKISLLSFTSDADIHFLHQQQVTPELFHLFFKTSIGIQLYFPLNLILWRKPDCRSLPTLCCVATVQRCFEA